MNYNISVDGYKGFRYLNNIETTRSKAIERLSSGYRINHTSDDAAGASLSNSLRTQIRGLMQASRNSEDMINLLNTAESGISAMTEMLQRIRELSVQAASDTNTTEDRNYMQMEVNQLLREIERTSKDTEFNGIILFNNDPDAVARSAGLGAVLGADHITPNGALSETLSTWDILDMDKKGENATQMYKTVITTDYKYNTCTSEYTYSNFFYDGDEHYGAIYRKYSSGQLFNSEGKVIGEVTSSGITLNDEGKKLLPSTAKDNPPHIQKDSYTYISPADSTDEPWTSNKEKLTYYVRLNDSQIYGKRDGQLVPLRYQVNEILTGTGRKQTVYTDYQGEHIAAMLDFEKFNEKGGYTKRDLYDTGFNSTCATCTNHYSIKFVRGTDSELLRNGSHYTLNIGIDVLDDLDHKPLGKDLAELVVKVAKKENFNMHYTQYAYVGSKLYLFDWRNNNEYNKDRPGSQDIFEAEVYGEVVIKEISRQPLVHAQVGSDTNDRVTIELPYISLKTLKLENVDITTRENATETIGRMDNTMAFLTKERAKISLWASRISHSASNADIGAYNNTLSDSKVMDTNYADEVLKLSKAQVLTEFGLSSVTEVHKMIENVLKFIS